MKHQGLFPVRAFGFSGQLNSRKKFAVIHSSNLLSLLLKSVGLMGGLWWGEWLFQSLFLEFEGLGLFFHPK